MRKSSDFWPNTQEKIEKKWQNVHIYVLSFLVSHGTNKGTIF